MNKKAILMDAIVLVAIAIGTAAILICAPMFSDRAEAVYEVAECPATEEATEQVSLVEEAEETTEEATEPTLLYDVPMDEELQLHIIKTAEANGIDPAIVIAMAWKESTYRSDAIGDGGNSLGLLQIQPRWHGGRMDKLGCGDLLDPYQNVTVGVDYLCELLSKYGDMGKALTAYNRGHYAGEVTNYAWSVMAKAEELGVQ